MAKRDESVLSETLDEAWDYPYMWAYCRVWKYDGQYASMLHQARREGATNDACYYSSGAWVRFFALHPSLQDKILGYISGALLDMELRHGQDVSRGK